METRKATRTPGGMTTLGGKPVEAAETVEIDYGKQGVSRAYIVMGLPLTAEERRLKQERIDRILQDMWISVQENRCKRNAEAAVSQ